ncbi:hypothetical protein DM860_012490 [Cuscuta australis]|uniref:EngB-type G domain-containing protein n=1 Tax=Cuscuta australis TaxID=267555 RepID=A0A328DGH7_9ASTE|nr:hypothetical protein DM860_012490 [Cuscuta australis]
MGLKTVKVEKKFNVSFGKCKTGYGSASEGKKSGSKPGVISFNGESVFGTGRRGRKEMPKFMGDSHIKSLSSGGRRKRISSSEGRSSDADIGLGSKKTFSGKRRDKIRVELHSGKQREYGEYRVYGKSSRGDTLSEGRKARESEFLSKKTLRAKPETSIKGHSFGDSRRSENGKRKPEVRTNTNKKENEQKVEPFKKSFKKNLKDTKRSADDEDITERPKKKKKRIRIDPHDGSNKRLEDDMSINDNNNNKKKKEGIEQTSNAGMSKNAQFRAIRPSPSILSFVEENLLGRRREIELRRAGYNVDLSVPLDNIPSLSSSIPTSERQQIEEPVFRNKLTFFAAAKVASSFPPPDLPEIAFAGRSNVGKSSLLNALTRQWGVARTSDKPGLTQTINFFNLGKKLCLVDLPGYGFAYAKEEVKETWQELVKEYVCTRVGLEKVCLLIDAKWGMRARDYELIEMMERVKRKYQIILTKSDTVFPIDVARRAIQIEENLKANKSAVQPLMMVSSRSGAGIRSLRTVLTKVARFAKP